ncbi:MAG: 50S ribosomal protein L19 [Mycoplasmoidaceae bacterium]
MKGIIMKINQQKILSGIENSQMKKNLPNFGPGDTIIVHNRITEGNKTRIQKFEGIILRRRGSGLSETFIIRKESNGIWVEEIIQIHSPLIEDIEVLRKGKVRRSYLTYQRNRTGKATRIKEKK